MVHEVLCATLLLKLDDLGQVVSLVHRGTGYEFLSAPGEPVGLWQMGIIRPVAWSDPLPAIRIPQVAYEGHEWWANRDEYKADLVVGASQAGVPRVSGTAEEATLVWTVPVPGGEADVTVQIAGGAGQDRLEFRIQVRLPGTWAMKRVTFPCIRGFGDTGDPSRDALLYPENWGVFRRNPLEDMTNYTGQYPGHANWCQMAAWFHDRAGLYLGILDPETHHTGIDAQYVEGAELAPWETERWHLPVPGRPSRTRPSVPLRDRLAAGVRPSFQFRVNHWPRQAAVWSCPYPVVLRGFTGGWFDAAVIHRDWATRQRWCRQGRLVDRSDAPRSLAQLDLWFTRYGFAPWSRTPKPAWEFQGAMHALHDYFQMPFGVHWYHWHNFSWHSRFPSHEPPVEGFEEVVDDLHRLGLVIMPYGQGRLLYRDRPEFAEERRHASVEANGQPYLEMYTPEDDWPLALCPGDAWSRGQWLRAATDLWRKYRVEGVYFDQITAMPPSLCYHAGHGHPLGGGTQYWEGYDLGLASMETLKRESLQRFLSSELLADAYLDHIDLYLAFVPPLEDYVPLFSAIYGGYTAVMGRSTPASAMADAQRFVMIQGEQLLFGGQLGWVNESILEYPESAKVLRDLARLRRRVRGWLHYGSLERPLEVTVQGERVLVDIPAALCGKPRPVSLDRPPVVHTVWRNPDGRVLVLWLNESRREASVRFSPRPGWRETAWDVWQQGVDAPSRRALGEMAVFEIPPLTAVAMASVEPVRDLRPGSAPRPPDRGSVTP
jgi:hypothetical protein